MLSGVPRIWPGCLRCAPRALVLLAALLFAGVCRAQTGACCTATGGCWLSSPAGCSTGYLGNGTLCSPNRCVPTVGACCNADGSCTLGAAAQCDGGLYRGLGTTCVSALCATPTGACCNALGACSMESRTTCQDAGSSYIADGMACGAGSACPLGACCSADGTCIAGIDLPDCASQGGAFQGIGAACAAVSCPQPPGACCTTNNCAVIPANIYAVFFGAWHGPASACGPQGDCPGTGLCCRGATCTDNTAEGDCIAPSSRVGAVFIAGSGGCGGSAQQHACCAADFNKIDGVNAQDIFDFLSAWFAGSPFCRVGGSADDPPTAADIFVFLSAWFVGCAD